SPSTAAGSTRSPWTTQARPPFAMMSAARESASARAVWQWIATAKPASASFSTMARPILLAPPVTSATSAIAPLSGSGGGAPLQPPLPVLGDAQVAIEGVVHRGHEAVDAPQRVATADIGLEEIRREFRDEPEDRESRAARIEVVGLRV